MKRNNKNRGKDRRIVKGEYRIDFANWEGKEGYVVVTSEKRHMLV